MHSHVLGRIRLVLAALILIVIALWFLAHGIWPHGLAARRTGEGILLLSANVFATAGLFRFASAILGEDASGNLLRFSAGPTRSGGLYPEKIPDGLRDCVAMTLAGVLWGGLLYVVSWATNVEQNSPQSPAASWLWISGNLCFDLYASYLAWSFATSFPGALLAITRIFAIFVGEALDRTLGQRMPALRILLAGWKLGTSKRRAEQLDAIAVLAALPSPTAEWKLVRALERPDMIALHPALIEALRKRGWVPVTPLHWQRVAVAAPSNEPGCINVLVGMLQDPNPVIHQSAARTLDRLGWSPDSPDAMVAFLMAQTLQHSPPDYTSVAREGQAAIRPLLHVLQGTFPGNQQSSLLALISIGGKRVERLIVERAAVNKSKALRNVIISGLSSCRDSAATHLLMKIFTADLAKSHVDPDVVSALELHSNRLPHSNEIVTASLTQAIVGASSPHLAKQVATILKSVNRQAWSKVCDEARRRKKAWMAPSKSELTRARNLIASVAEGGDVRTRASLAYSLRRFLEDYAAWMHSSDLKVLSQLQILLTQTYIETHYSDYDVCGNPVGEGSEESHTVVLDSAPLKQLARQELIRRGEAT